MLQDNKSLNKSYEDYLIDKFQPLLNKKTGGAKSTKKAVLVWRHPHTQYLDKIK